MATEISEKFMLVLRPTRRRHALGLSEIEPVARDHGPAVMRPGMRRAAVRTVWGDVEIRRYEDDRRIGFGVYDGDDEIGLLEVVASGSIAYYVARGSDSGAGFILRASEDSVFPGELTGADHRFCGYTVLAFSGRVVGSVSREGCRVDAGPGKAQLAVRHRLVVTDDGEVGVDPRLWAGALLVLAGEAGDPRERVAAEGGRPGGEAPA